MPPTGCTICSRPLSFRARLAQHRLSSTTTAGRSSRGVGFFIEDFDDVAQRNGTARSARRRRASRSADLSPADAARYAVFQHMIANHDWSMRAGPAGDECCHNAG